MKLRRPRRPRRFRPADSAQQTVGGFLLAGPFVVTEEVWLLAENMSLFQALATISMVFAIGYATLYKADTNREQTEEQNIAGIPTRFISLMLVSFGSVTILALLFGAPETFLEANLTDSDGALTTFKTISVGSVFSITYLGVNAEVCR